MTVAEYMALPPETKRGVVEILRGLWKLHGYTLRRTLDEEIADGDALCKESSPDVSMSNTVVIAYEAWKEQQGELP